MRVLPVPVSSLHLLPLLAVSICLWLAGVSGGSSATRPGQAATGDKATANLFTNCGGKINTTLGYIHTPNFPHRFPSPIACRWLFHAPPGKRIILYLTQFYLHNSFRVAEFSYYSEDTNGRATWRGRYDFGEINFEEAYLASSKPYLLIDFRVTDINNIHLRVDEYLLDVYGFNITYEMVDEDTPVRTDACTVIKCSFLGHCLAAANLDTYKCHCFPSYYGDECQYGPSCDPDKGINMCLNGGKCRYFLGSNVNTCQCPPGFHGAQCESKIDFTNPECEALGCQQRCVAREAASDEDDATSLGAYDGGGEGGDAGKEYMCACNEGYRLAKDNKTCEEQGRLRYLIEVRMVPGEGGAEASEDYWTPCSHFDELFSEQAIQQLSANLSGFWNFSIENKRRDGKDLYIQFAFFGEKSEQETVWIKMQLVRAHLNVCGWRADGEYLEEDIQPALHSLSLRQYDADHAISGQFLTLACKAKGSRNTRFTWYKDGHEIRFDQSTRDIWETRIPSSDGETHLSVLSIEKALPIDDGEFSCEVSDWNQVERKSISIYIVPIPEIDLSPLHVTLREGEKGAMTCMSRDDEHANFTYSWLYNGRPLTTGPNGEHVEKLAPIGSRLTLKRVTQAASYTCVVRSLAGTASKTTIVSLLAANGLYCESEGDPDEGVRWNLTPANQSDIVRCPRETQEWILKHNPLSRNMRHYVWRTGTAYRACTCTATRCRWQEPNFANCSTIELDQLNNELSQIAGGYQTPNVFALLRKMSIYMLNEDPDRPYYVGNLLVQVHMLRQMFSYSQTFLSNDPINAVDFVQVIDVAGLILERAFSYNLMRGERMQVVSNIMALTGEMQTLHKQAGFGAGLERHNTSSLVMIARPTCYTLVPDVVSVIEPYQEFRFADHFFACNAQFLIVYRHIHSLFYNQSIFEEYYVNSLVTYVSAATVGSPATVTIPHLRQLSEKSSQANMTRCLSLAVSDGGELVWRRRGCDVLMVHSLYTVCRCKWSGHYAVLQSTAEPPLPFTLVVTTTPPETIVLCYLALGTFIILLAAQLKYKRHLHPVETAVDVNICAAMVLVCIILVSMWSRSDDKVLCMISKAGQCCGFLVALTTLVFEMLHQLQPSHRTHTIAWIMLITMTAWGISAVVCVATVLPAHFVRPSTRQYNLCGITVDHWSFYILLTVIITELMTLSALIVLVVVGVRARRQRMSNCAMIILESEQEQRNLSCLVGKSLVTTFWLLLAFASVIVATMSSALSSQLLVALSLMFLGLCRIFFAWLPDVKKKVSLNGRSCSFSALKKPIVKTTEQPSNQKKDYSKKEYALKSADSIAFIKSATPTVDAAIDKITYHSEHAGASGSKEERGAGESASAPDTDRTSYYNHSDETSEVLIRDSQRYTKEKFEQLSALLGSSLKSAQQGGAGPVFSLSGALHSRSRDAAYYSQVPRPGERHADTSLRSSNYSVAGTGNGVSPKPDLVPNYGAYPLMKPARGISYIRVPSTDGGHSAHDVQKQCFAANYPEG